VERKPITYNLFVANFPYEARSKDLKEFFDSGTGKVFSAEVIYQENPRRPSGYGFVSFTSKKEANEALAEFQGKVTHYFLHQFFNLNLDSWVCVTSLSNFNCNFLELREKNYLVASVTLENLIFLQNFMGRPLRVAPSKRFVRLAEESAGSEDASSELNVNEAEADKTDWYYWCCMPLLQTFWSFSHSNQQCKVFYWFKWCVFTGSLFLCELEADQIKEIDSCKHKHLCDSKFNSLC